MKIQAHNTREEWLAARGLGASDIGVICGFVKWKSPYTLWCEKMGLIPPQEENIAMRTGHALEPIVASLYEETTGAILFDPGPFTICSHDDYPWLTCTPDRVIASHVMDTWIPERAVELKTMGRYYAKTLADGDAPDPYKLQLMTQLEILGCKEGDLACLIDNRDFEIYPFERHDRLIQGIIKKAEEFWDRLQNNDPPPVDGSESTARALAAQWRQDTGECIQLPEDAAESLRRLIDIKSEIKTLESEKGSCENIIRAALGDATRGECDGAHVTWKTQLRKGYLKVDEMARDVLVNAGIAFKETNGSEMRVMRTGGNTE